MNNKYDCWFWKSPKDLFDYHKWNHLVRNPVLLICFRNVLGVVASSESKEHINWYLNVKYHAHTESVISEIIEMTPYPVLTFDYELFLKDVRRFIFDIAEVLNINVASETLEKCINFFSIGKYSDVGASGVVISPEDLRLDAENAQKRVFKESFELNLLRIEDIFCDSVNAVLICNRMALKSIDSVFHDLACVAVFIKENLDVFINTNNRVVSALAILRDMNFFAGELPLNRYDIKNIPNLIDCYRVSEEVIRNMMTIRSRLQVLLESGQVDI